MQTKFARNFFKKARGRSELAVKQLRGSIMAAAAGTLDFSDDDVWMSKVNMKHCVKLDTPIGKLRFNWVSSLLASIIL